MDLRVASAIDVHAFGDDLTKPLRLACITWEEDRALSGHSDGDVAAHAVADALLMASGIGELGSVFGVDKPEYAGASGERILRETLSLLKKENWKVNNISVQIIAQRPKFSPRKKEAEKVMEAIIGAPVSVSATSTDHLGTLGRMEGIGALATVCIVKG